MKTEHAPRVYSLRGLYKICASPTEMTEYSPGQWGPARPMNFASLRERFQIAWLVFSGGADAVVWPQDDQQEQPND